MKKKDYLKSFIKEKPLIEENKDSVMEEIKPIQTAELEHKDEEQHSEQEEEVVEKPILQTKPILKRRQPIKVEEESDFSETEVDNIINERNKFQDFLQVYNLYQTYEKKKPLPLIAKQKQKQIPVKRPYFNPYESQVNLYNEEETDEEDFYVEPTPKRRQPPPQQSQYQQPQYQQSQQQTQQKVSRTSRFNL